MYIDHFCTIRHIEGRKNYTIIEYNDGVVIKVIQSKNKITLKKLGKNKDTIDIKKWQAPVIDEYHLKSLYEAFNKAGGCENE